MLTLRTKKSEDTEPYPNSFSKPKYIRKPCLFNTLQDIKFLQPAGLREKFNSLHFPETENGRGFDSQLHIKRSVIATQVSKILLLFSYA